MDRVIKILIPSIAALVIATILYFLNLAGWNNYVFILSAIIQILTFVYWLIGDSTQRQILETAIETKNDLEETKQIAQEIKDFQNQKEGLLEKRQRILVNLLKNGAIQTIEINKIIKSVKRKGMFVVSSFGGHKMKLKGVLNLMGRTEPVSIIPEVLYNIGFKKVYRSEFMFIILKEDLPPRLRNSEKLKRVIYNELINKWSYLQDLIKNNNFKKYDKWKEGSKFLCNLCLIDIEEGEIGILYKRLKESSELKDSFSEEFKSLLLSHSDKGKIGQLIRDKIKANQVLDKITISLLLNNLPDGIKKALLTKEKELMNQLNIKRFIDISNIKEANLQRVIGQYIPQGNIEETSGIIMSEIKDYVQVVRELELFK
ncbi:MAG: hypothetical protein ABIH63_01970 [archaeon]